MDTSSLVPAPGAARDTTFHAIALDYCADDGNWTVGSIDVRAIAFTG